jgi:GTP-binding protein
MIDRVEIWVKAGNGGNGVISFRREKFVPFGGPDGGDGGDGGSIFLVASRGLSTLTHLRQRRHYRARKGEHGKGKNRHGKRGNDVALAVPLGTLVQRKEDNGRVTLADLTVEGQRVLVAKGGRGGWGNAHFATPTNQAPRIAQEGKPGEEWQLLLDLKLLADVGIIGYPNVGKSTLLSSVSRASPKVADYPFTTTEPVLGVVELGYRAFVLAEIPGLIEGAHQGRGLGHDFLRHIERTRVLIHLLDGSAEHPLSDLNKTNEELRLFNPALGEKPQLVAINKIDLPSVRTRLPELRRTLRGIEPPVYFISAATGEGIAELMNKTAELLQLSLPQPEAEAAEFKVFRPKPVK